jgi:hypothetical protein
MQSRSARRCQSRILSSRYYCSISYLLPPAFAAAFWQSAGFRLFCLKLCRRMVLSSDARTKIAPVLRGIGDFRSHAELFGVNMFDNSD